MIINRLTFRPIFRLCTLMERVASLLLLPIIILIINIDVALRSTDQISLTWSHEVLGLLMLFLFILSLPNSAQNNELIRVDLLSRFLPNNIQFYIQKITHLLSAVIAGILTYQCIVASIDMHTYDDRVTSLAIPLWPLASALTLLSIIWAAVHMVLLLTPASQPINHD
ncbi:hypothetical protein A9Q99_16525 [Gammaproteobacteria bacterium 45_16_T64]|nr:hypothetical protein A9Q99_16525 [Gammaproteobacteria bacterium 45_16_T64]